MINPFTIGIVTGKDFCNRVEEKNTLLNRARNGQSLVLYAKRRMGKSSLVKQVLKEVAHEGILTVYANLFSISSERDFIATFASAIARGVDKSITDPRTMSEKLRDIFSRIRIGIEATPQGIEFTAGFDRSLEFSVLLEDLMRGLYGYVEKNNLRAVIALDEFQEITELPAPKRIEGTLRSYMQEHRSISYFYIGSRRRVLLDMFTDKRRPFYKSAFTYSIGEIPRQDFAPYITERFKETGKKCPKAVSEFIYDSVSGYPYYVQKLASLCWDITEKLCDEETVKRAYAALLDLESHSDFESILNGLTMGQKALLKAIAKEPTATPFAKDYLGTYSLSQSSAQRAIEALMKRDIIEKHEGIYRTTDPVFGAWFKTTG